MKDDGSEQEFELSRAVLQEPTRRLRLRDLRGQSSSFALPGAVRENAAGRIAGRVDAERAVRYMLPPR